MRKMYNLFFEKLYDVIKVPVRVYQDQMRAFLYPEKYEFPFESEKEFLKIIENSLKDRQPPFVLLENENICFGVLKDSEENLVIIGPISRKPLDKAEKLNYWHNHFMPGDMDICYMEMKKLMALLSFVGYELCGKDIPLDEIKIGNVINTVLEWNIDAVTEHYQLEQSEYERDHDSSEYENRMLDIVRSGNVEEAEKLVYGSGLEQKHIGAVAVNSQKKAEYLCVAMITLLSRAAVEGGMNHEKSYSLADIYMQQLEKCKSAMEMYAVSNRALFEYTSKVRRVRKEKSKPVYIEQCKEYIAKNLRKPIKVGDIAPAIGINRSYLARRFSETEGITIQNYIIKERCAHAANMLKFSDYPLAVISEYFCFSSQSHFGKCFREIYNMTPGEYRNRYKKTQI